MLPRTRKQKLTERLRSHLWGHLTIGTRISVFRVIRTYSRWVWNNFL